MASQCAPLTCFDTRCMDSESPQASFKWALISFRWKQSTRYHKRIGCVISAKYKRQRQRRTLFPNVPITMRNQVGSIPCSRSSLTLSQPFFDTQASSAWPYTWGEALGLRAHILHPTSTGHQSQDHKFLLDASQQGHQEAGKMQHHSNFQICQTPRVNIALDGETHAEFLYGVSSQFTPDQQAAPFYQLQAVSRLFQTEGNPPRLDPSPLTSFIYSVSFLRPRMVRELPFQRRTPSLFCLTTGPWRIGAPLYLTLEYCISSFLTL